MQYKRYFVRECNKMEMVECPTCKGEKTIDGVISSESLDESFRGKVNCPTCGGLGEITTGKQIKHEVGTVVIYGSAHVEENDNAEDFILGFVCDDDSKIEDFKNQNGVDSFVTFPSLLTFYLKSTEQTLFDTREEAEAEITRLEGLEIQEPKFKVEEVE